MPRQHFWELLAQGVGGGLKGCPGKVDQADAGTFSCEHCCSKGRCKPCKACFSHDVHMCNFVHVVLSLL